MEKLMVNKPLRDGSDFNSYLSDFKTLFFPHPFRVGYLMQSIVIKFRLHEFSFQLVKRAQDHPPRAPD